MKKGQRSCSRSFSSGEMNKMNNLKVMNVTFYLRAEFLRLNIPHYKSMGKYFVTQGQVTQK